MKLKVFIPGEPRVYKLQARVIRAGRGGEKARAQLYEKPESRSWKGVVQHHMIEAVSKHGAALPMFQRGALGLVVRVTWPLPKSKRRKKPVPESWREQMPDGSNALKAIEDAGNGVVWYDDKQIAYVRLEKTTAAQGGSFGTWIEVFRLPSFVQSRMEG